MLGAVGLWVDSYSSLRSLSYEGQDWIHVAASDTGQCALMMADNYLSEPPEGWKLSRDDAYGDMDEFSSAYSAGFGGAWGLESHGFDIYALVTPHWFPILILAVLPAIWLYKWNKRRKLGPNACPGCGYDLTGNETGVCPECGVGANEQAID